jgi:hypothetical protein
LWNILAAPAFPFVNAAVIFADFTNIKTPVARAFRLDTSYTSFSEHAVIETGDQRV